MIYKTFETPHLGNRPIEHPYVHYDLRLGLFPSPTLPQNVIQRSQLSLRFLEPHLSYMTQLAYLGQNGFSNVANKGQSCFTYLTRSVF